MGMAVSSCHRARSATSVADLGGGAGERRRCRRRPCGCGRRRRPRPGSRASWPPTGWRRSGWPCCWPAMSGAEPCTGSNIDGPVRAGLRLPDEARPMPPRHRAAEVGEDVAEQVVGDDHVVRAGRSARSRCRPRRRGCRRWSTSGYSAATSSNVRCHRSPAKVSTLVLCTSVRCLRGAAAGQLEGVADAALDAHAGVDRALGGDLVRGALAQEAALAGVGALGVLADDDEVVRRRRGPGTAAG